MAQFKDGDVQTINGVTYRRQGGQWLPAQTNPMNNPMVDPRLQYQVQSAQGQAAAAPYEAPKAQAQTQIAQAQAGVAPQVAQADAQRAVAEAEKAKVELEKLKLAQSQADPKSGAYKALQQQIDRVSELYRQNLQGGLPNVLNSVIPDPLQPGKSQFDSAAQGLVNPFQAAFKVQGQGSQSDTELKQFIEANVPQQGDSDGVIEEKLGNIQRRLDAEVPPPPPAAPPSDPMALATGATRDQIDPTLKAVGDRVGQMIARGDKDVAIMKFLRDSGVNPADTSIGQALHFRHTKDFQTWQRQNPGAAYPIGPSFYTKPVPMTDARALFNKTAATDLGGTAAAYGASAGNAITGGRLDNLTADPAMARTGMDLLRGTHPFASLAGDVTGQALVEGSVGRVPGLQGLMATRMGRRGADALYGAYSGSGEADGDALTGAGVGALANLGGGMFGRGAQRGLGRAMTGVRNAHLGYLDRAGVPLTVGQIGRGSENIVGRTVGGLEERARGLPGLDAIIGTARQRGDRGFNAAAFREMGGSGATGAAGIAEGQGLVNNAYSFLDPINLPYDAQFAGSQAGIRANLPRNLGAGVSDRLDTIDNAVTNGGLSGRAWQDSLRGVRADRASLRGQPFSDQAINSLDNVEGNLQGLALRQGPAGTAENLTNANRLNAQFQTLSSALDNGPAQKADELFSAGRLDDASRVNARNFGGRTASLTGNRPFYDLTTAGKNVMPSLTPDSGTAGRMALAYGLMGAGGAGLGAITGDEKGSGSLDGLAGGVTAATLLSAPYGHTGQRLLQRALLGQRPRQIERLGDYLINNPRLAGMFGSALGRDYIYQPEINP